MLDQVRGEVQQVLGSVYAPDCQRNGLNFASLTDRPLGKFPYFAFSFFFFDFPYILHSNFCFAAIPPLCPCGGAL
jgi:hypothetical protein